MDVGIVVPGDSLEQHGGRITVLIPTGVIRAGVTTRLIVGGGQSAVCGDQGFCKLVGSAVDVVRFDSNDLGGSRFEAMSGE